MKKLTVLFSFLIISSMIFATNPDAVVRRADNYKLYTGVASDTVNGATTLAIDFYVEYAKEGRYTLSFWIDGDTLTGCTGNTTIQAQGLYDLTYGTTTNVGSSITWTSSSAVYLANTNLNTYSVAVAGTETNAQHTETTAAFNIFTYDSLLYDDTLHVPQQVNTVAAQTVTVAVTNTVTLPGVDFPYIRILFTGASGTRIEVDYIGIKVTPIDVPK